MRTLLPVLLVAVGCVERPLDGGPGGELGNAVTGYAPAARWEARVEAYDSGRERFAPVPLYDTRGRSVAALRADEAPAAEVALLTPANERDLLHRYAGFYDLPEWAWRFERARVRVVLRAPGTTTYTPAFAYSRAAYHGCLVARAEGASDLRDLGAHCADRLSVTLVRSLPHDRAPRTVSAPGASVVRGRARAAP